MSFGVAPPPPRPVRPALRPITLKSGIKVGLFNRSGRLEYYPGPRRFYLFWEGIITGSRGKILSIEEAREHLTEEQIAQCLAASIAAGANP